MEPNYVWLNPETVEQERNPVALLRSVSFLVRAKQNCQTPVLPYELQTHMIWVRAIPHCCASRSASKNLWKIMKAELKVCALLWYPRPRNSCPIPLLAAHSYRREEKGLNASIVCLKMRIVSFLWPLLESYKGSIVTHWRVKCINHTSPHVSKASNHKQKHVPFYNC